MEYFKRFFFIGLGLSLGVALGFMLPYFILGVFLL